MSIAELSRKVEIHFWDWAIPTLSASRLVQKCVCLSYRIIHKNAHLSLYWIAAGISALGFINGMIAFWVIAR